jgi:Zn-dependent peptidase ImmA (M78 family)
VVAWAIQEDGRPLVEIAAAAKVPVRELQAWGRGEAAPVVGQVTELAKALRRPRAMFFLPRPPEQATLPTTFRHPPGDESRQVSAHTRRLVRRSRRLQQAISWVVRDQPPTDMPRVDAANASPEATAERVRTWLRLVSDVHRQWSNDYDALSAWREAMDSRGVLVFALELGLGEVRGFSAWDDRAPLIVTNISSVSPPARCFTLAHEMGHLVARQDATCIEPSGLVDQATIERWCEEFGAALLMPADEVRRLARQRRIHSATVDDVKAVAATFRVSHRAATLRLIHLGFADRGLYAAVLRIFRPSPKRQVADGYRRPSRATSRLREYGPRTLETVLNELPSRDAMSLLHVDVEDVRRLADAVPGVRAI